MDETSAQLCAEVVEHEEGEHVPAYLAKKPLKMSATDTRHPGEQVPEAASWPNLANWIATGHVEEISDTVAKAMGIPIAAKPKAPELAKKTEAKPAAKTA